MKKAAMKKAAAVKRPALPSTTPTADPTYYHERPVVSSWGHNGLAPRRTADPTYHGSQGQVTLGSVGEQAKAAKAAKPAEAPAAEASKAKAPTEEAKPPEPPGGRSTWGNHKDWSAWEKWCLENPIDEAIKKRRTKAENMHAAAAAQGCQGHESNEESRQETPC